MKTKQLSIATLTLAAVLTACNSGSKNQNSDEWVIKNDVWKVEDIDFDEIAEVVDIKPIATDEPIAELRPYMSGTSNDFIACDKFSRQIFYHIVDGRMTEKLQAAGNGPNEYNHLDYYSYLPADSLLYGYDRRGRIIRFRTSPFKFESYFPTDDYFVDDLVALGRDRLLLSAYTRPDSSSIYEFDGQSMAKIIDVNRYASNIMFPTYSRSDNGVLMAVKQENIIVCQYAEGQMTKIATIDYGNMELTKDKEYITTLEGGLQMLNFKDFAMGCKYAIYNGSTLAYWYRSVLKQEAHNHLTIATRDNYRNYNPHIGGLKIEVHPGLVDNGIYSMLIQGDWESKINADEELSETGKRIIEAMKGNDYNPVILQFKLKL